MVEFCTKLKHVIDNVNPKSVPSWIHRYHRKLSVSCCQETSLWPHQKNERAGTDEDCILIEEQTVFTSYITPYTLRTLKPFILVDRETVPPRLQLLTEICQKQNRQYKRYPLIYKYVERRHIKPINKLCETHFWPGIDISEALEFPEFSVVVEYRRIVVAFGFLVPNVSHSDAYISFIFTLPGWRRAGIAKYMLYHLIHTCQGKDITLHVSASNSQALFLYQQFAFKPEEFIQNFYDKFIPANSRECRHAFFLRLSK